MASLLSEIRCALRLRRARSIRLTLLLFAAACLQAAEPVYYEVRFPNAVHHEAEVSITFPGSPPTLEVRMSRTSPGRYALHEFAKNVYNVSATDGAGRQLTITRPNPHQWNISGHDGTVRFRYTLFGDRADGTYVGIDRSHAHLNMPAAFAWARGLINRPVRIQFVPPEDLRWKVATQLKPTAGPFTFEAPSRDYFLDSPTELSDYTSREFEIPGARGAQTIRLALHHEGSEAEATAFAGMTKAVVLEQAGIYGEFPKFDYGVYTFLLDYLPWVQGDGMEHRNSTYCVSTGSLRESGSRLIGTVAHEFFHAWNVERLRPASLEPFDFEQASIPQELWFGEGFTSYYTPLTLVRAGLIGLDRYAGNLGDIGHVINSPARAFVSPVEASQMASIADGASHGDQTNFRNTYLSYYTYGAAVGLGLDLTLRTCFKNISLDDYMRALWRKYGRAEQPYTMDGLEQTLGELTGDPVFAAGFFRRYIRGREVVDYKDLLRYAGLLLREWESGKAVLGEPQLDFEKDGAVLTSLPAIGTPIYEAGVSRGAKISKLDGKRIRGRKDWDNALKKKQPGDTVEIEYVQRGAAGTKRIRLAASRRLEVVTFESAGMEVTPEIAAFRESWLGSKAIADLPELSKYHPKTGKAYPFSFEHSPDDGATLVIAPPE